MHPTATGIHLHVSSLIALFGGFSLLPLLLWSFLRARMAAADIEQLEGMMPKEVRSGDFVADYAHFSEILRANAPAAYRRQELWLRAYARVLLFAVSMNKASEFVHGELRALLASQAALYAPAYREIVASAGAQFVGFSCGVAWFEDPVTHSTLALPISRITQRSVAEKLHRSRQQFGTATEPTSVATGL